MALTTYATGKYIPLAGFVTRLTENINHKQAYFPVEQKDYNMLLDKLADGDYSFLEIRDGNAIEVVKVINLCDTIIIERGEERTKRKAFRCGVGVAFIQTMQGVKDTVCQMEHCDE